MLETARLTWDEHGRPYSPMFGDIYFSRADGLAEGRAVFLGHNDLVRRWRDFPGSVFTIAELGFGMGLNFLATWQAFSADCHPFTLRFVAVEKYPLAVPDLRKALGLWPELEAFSAQLLHHYPPPAAGRHCLQFNGVRLELYLGDVQSWLARECPEPIDAWYLDGFAPAKNPAMWEIGLFQRMAALSRPGTTFSTYSAAGQVRRGLQQAGFQVRKVPGFGDKREMLRGWRA